MNHEPITMLDQILAEPALAVPILNVLKSVVSTLDFYRASDHPEVDDVKKTEDSSSFYENLSTIAHGFLMLDASETATRIAHWCTQERDKGVKGFSSYPIYWLTLSRCPDPEGDVHLSIWAVGPDMNAEEEAIKVWVKEHFGSEYEIKNLQQVRRGKFTA